MASFMLLVLAVPVASAAPAGSATSPGTSWASSWRSIHATAARVATVEAEFVQRKRMPILTHPLVSRGKLFFDAARHHLRWEYRAPLRSLLEMKDGRVRRYLWEGGRFRLDARQRQDAMQIVLTEISLWLSGRFRQSPNFSAVLQAKPQPRILLRPKKRALARYIQRILLVPRSQPGAISKVVIYEGGGATTTLEFVRCTVHYR